LVHSFGNASKEYLLWSIFEISLWHLIKYSNLIVKKWKKNSKREREENIACKQMLLISCSKRKINSNKEQINILSAQMGFELARYEKKS